MGISINIQRIARATAKSMKGWSFSTVDLFNMPSDSREDACRDSELSIFLEGPGHEDTAARIAALINEQVTRRDTAPNETPPWFKPLSEAEIDARNAEDEAEGEQQRQQEEAADEIRREQERGDFCRANPNVRDREERRDDDLPF